MKNTRTAGLCLSLAVLASGKAAAATITVNAGSSLQAAINAAKPGDTILLQAGATFTGPFTLPAKSGTASCLSSSTPACHITIRSSALDAQLPAAGQRINPTYGSLLPKIRATSSGAAMRTDPGATYWRLLFLEFLPAASDSSANLVEFGGGSSSTQSTLSSVPNHLVMDGCYLHGNPSYGQRRGLALNSGDTQVVNSYFADFKGLDKDRDTQAIGGWNGPGPFLIENNYLEAAGESLMFGGSDPSIVNLVPSDIVIRRNLITKNTAWMTQAWIVKNLVEFKNAQNVLVDGNTIEHTWAAAQDGYAILFTPRQGGNAPWTVVRDIVVQNNVIRHVAGAVNICGYNDDATKPSQQTQNITIRNNLLYDVNTRSNGRLVLIGGGPRNITFDHNTVDNNGSQTILVYGGYTPTGNTSILNFKVTNNLLRDNAYGIFGDKQGEGTVALTYYTPNAEVLRNTFAAGNAKQYPSGNDFPTLTQWLGDFVDCYHLRPGSPSKGTATDGKDLGVDFSALDNVIVGGCAAVPTLPGKIEFENYDAFGGGTAYGDTTTGNSGNAYRSDNVDIQATTDAGGGHNLAWVKATEWLNYTVAVATTAVYAVDVRVASSGAGGIFHIEVDGIDKTGPVGVPNTGAWQTWRTITVTGVSLTSGTHVARVVMDTNGATGSIGNFNWFAVR